MAKSTLAWVSTAAVAVLAQQAASQTCCKSSYDQITIMYLQIQTIPMATQLLAQKKLVLQRQALLVVLIIGEWSSIHSVQGELTLTQAMSRQWTLPLPS